MSIEQLVEFIDNPKIEVKLAAIEQVLGFSGTPEGRFSLLKTDVVRILIKYIGSTDQKLNINVLKSLINLSEDPDMLNTMIERHIISRTVDTIGDNESSSEVVEHCAMLLVNVTRTPEGVFKLLQVGEPLMGYSLLKLLMYFCKSVPKGGKDLFAFIASVITNVTQTEEGRKLILDKTRGILLKLLPYIHDGNVIRRRGLISALRNCLFEKEYHDWLFSDEVKILTYLLLPFRGTEEFDKEDQEGMPDELKKVVPDKKKEQDIECKKLLIDCITLLTATPKGRAFMKAKKVYPILREYDLREEDDEIHEKIYHLVHVLVLEEVPDAEVKERIVSRRLQNEVDEEGEPIEEI
eukprot:TRINITY_DN9620_c0_g1_i3.p1 TRINITY_DN9620_c0_g1~~TRINITY_DN9620_c0_g1_i3.p1  ORF type:complete len:351 (-),score=58.70 TRINITY_DN9620_c0_g1_i3:46-1098(-)